MTITINTRKSAAIEEWMMKEEGSFEDHNKASDHAYAILRRFGGRLELTEEEANTLICSGEYQSTGWNDDEIDGGAKTKATIARYVKKIADALEDKREGQYQGQDQPAKTH